MLPGAFFKIRFGKDNHPILILQEKIMRGVSLKHFAQVQGNGLRPSIRGDEALDLGMLQVGFGKRVGFVIRGIG